MSKSNDAVGYVTSVSGDSPDSESAIAFEIYVPSESQGDPYDNQAAAEEGHHTFTIKKIKDNRALVWVSLLRDAMVHRLLTRVTYQYSAKSDPGSGEIVRIEVVSFPFQPGFMSSVRDKVTEISIGEYFVWKKEFEIIIEDIIDAAYIYLENEQGLFVLPLSETNKETKQAQLNLLQLAWETQCDVTITYKDLPSGLRTRYARTILGVTIYNR